MKQSILFDIRSSHDDCKDLVVNKISFSGKILIDHIIKDSFKTKDENCIKFMCSKVVQQFESSPINIIDENLVQITNNICTVHDLDSKYNNNETKKSLITSTKITNESTQHISNTKLVFETTCDSAVLDENSSFDKLSSMIANNNADKKMLLSSVQEIVSNQNIEDINKS